MKLGAIWLAILLVSIILLAGVLVFVIFAH
jgi:hypothetical protein